MKKHLLFIAILIVSLLMPTRLLATDKLLVVPNASLGLIDYRYRQEFPDVPITLRAHMPYLRIGTVLAYDKLFVGVNHQQTTKAQDSYSLMGHNGTVDFDLRKSSIAVGTTLGRKRLKFSPYMGYVYRKGDFASFEVAGNKDIEIEHKTSGFFLGLTESLHFEKGTFSLNLSLARIRLDNDTSSIFTNNSSVVTHYNWFGGGIRE